MVAVPALKVFAAIVRVLLALAFTPSGYVKLIGERFTTLPATTPVGSFFEGFFSAPGYYGFVGAMQLLAAVLLLFPATAALGALVYLPIVLNIFVITVAVDFRGTAVVTGLMLLANVFLLLWDYDRWRALLPGAAAVGGRHVGALRTGMLYAAAAIGFFGIVRLHLARLRHASLAEPAMLVGAGAILGFAGLWLVFAQARRERYAAESPSSSPM
jgi:hypothetical protein